VVKCQATRSRSENFKIAKRILAEKVEFLAKGDESRAAKVEERARRKKASQGKKTRRKYKRLAGERGELGADADADADGEEDGDEDGAEGVEEGDAGTGTGVGGQIKHKPVEVEGGQQHLERG
jgi:protein subunit release factor B